MDENKNTTNQINKNSSKNESFSMSKGIVVSLEDNTKYNDYKYGYEVDNNNKKTKKDINAKGIINEIDAINKKEDIVYIKEDKKNNIEHLDKKEEKYNYTYGYEEDDNDDEVIAAKTKESNDGLVKKSAVLLAGIIGAGALVGGGYYLGKNLVSAIKNGKLDNKSNGNSNNNGNSNSNGNTNNNGEAIIDDDNDLPDEDIDTSITTDNNQNNQNNNSNNNNRNSNGNRNGNSDGKQIAGGSDRKSNYNSSDNKSGRKSGTTDTSDDTRNGKSDGKTGGMTPPPKSEVTDVVDTTDDTKDGKSDGKTGGMTPPSKEEVTDVVDTTDDTKDGKSDGKTGGMTPPSKDKVTDVIEIKDEEENSSSKSGDGNNTSVPATASGTTGGSGGGTTGGTQGGSSGYSGAGLYINPTFVRLAIQRLKSLTSGDALETLQRNLAKIKEPDCAPKNNSYLEDTKKLMNKVFEFGEDYSAKKLLSRLENLWELLDMQYNFDDFDIGMMDFMDLESTYEDGEISYYDRYAKACEIAARMKAAILDKYSDKDEIMIRLDQINLLRDNFKSGAFFEVAMLYEQSLTDDSVTLTPEQLAFYKEEFKKFDVEMTQLNRYVGLTYDTKVKNADLSEDIVNKYSLLDDEQLLKMTMWSSIKLKELSSKTDEDNLTEIYNQMQSYYAVYMDCTYASVMKVPENELSEREKTFKIEYKQYKYSKDINEKSAEENKYKNELKDVDNRIDVLTKQMQDKSYESMGIEVHSTGAYATGDPHNYKSFDELAENNQEYQELLKRRDYLNDKIFSLIDEIDYLEDCRFFNNKLLPDFEENNSSRIFRIEDSNKFGGYKVYYDKDGNVITDVTEKELALYFAEHGGYNHENYSYKDADGKMVKINIQEVKSQMEQLKYLDVGNDFTDVNLSERIKILNYINNTQSKDMFDLYYWTNIDLGNKIEGKRQSDAWIADLADDWDGLRELHLLSNSVFNNGIMQHLDGWINFDGADGKLSARDYKMMYDNQGMIDLFGKYGENLNSLNEIGTSIGNMIPSVAVTSLSYLFPVFGATKVFSYAGTFCMFVSAAGNSKEQGMQSGMTEEQAMMYGLLCGTSEAFLERIIGGITGVSDNNAGSKIASFFHVPEFVGKMISEGNEEFIQELLDPMFKCIVTGEFDGFDLNAAIKSGVYGFITAGVMNGSGYTINSTVSTYLTGNPHMLSAVIANHSGDNFILNESFLNDCEILKNSNDSFDTLKGMLESNPNMKTQYDAILSENPDMKSSEFTFDDFLNRVTVNQILDVAKDTPEIQKLGKEITKLNSQLEKLYKEYNSTKDSALLGQIKDLKNQLNTKSNELNGLVKDNMTNVPLKVDEYISRYSKIGEGLLIDSLISDNHINMDLYNQLISFGEAGSKIKESIDNYVKNVKGGLDGYISNTIKNKIANKIININSIIGMDISYVENIKNYKYKFYSYDGKLMTYSEFANLFNDPKVLVAPINSDTENVKKPFNLFDILSNNDFGNGTFDVDGNTMNFDEFKAYCNQNGMLQLNETQTQELLKNIEQLKNYFSLLDDNGKIEFIKGVPLNIENYNLLDNVANGKDILAYSKIESLNDIEDLYLSLEQTENGIFLFNNYVGNNTNCSKDLYLELVKDFNWTIRISQMLKRGFTVDEILSRFKIEEYKSFVNFEFEKYSYKDILQLEGTITIDGEKFYVYRNGGVIPLYSQQEIMYDFLTADDNTRRVILDDLLSKENINLFQKNSNVISNYEIIDGQIKLDSNNGNIIERLTHNYENFFDIMRNVGFGFGADQGINISEYNNKYLSIDKNGNYYVSDPKYQQSYDKMVDVLSTKYNMDAEIINRTIVEVVNNHFGACSYADFANTLFALFKNNPVGFKNTFGFDMYDTIDGQVVLNSETLMLDIYIYVNTIGNNPDAKIYTFDANGKRIFSEVKNEGRLADSREQVYITKDSISTSYLNQYGLDVKISRRAGNNITDIKEMILRGWAEGKLYSLHEERKADPIRFIPIDLSGYHQSTDTWNERGSHITAIVGYNNEGFIVASWGEKYLVKYEDLKSGNFYVKEYDFANKEAFVDIPDNSTITLDENFNITDLIKYNSLETSNISYKGQEYSFEEFKKFLNENNMLKTEKSQIEQLFQNKHLLEEYVSLLDEEGLLEFIHLLDIDKTVMTNGIINRDIIIKNLTESQIDEYIEWYFKQSDAGKRVVGGWFLEYSTNEGFIKFVSETGYNFSDPKLIKNGLTVDQQLVKRGLTRDDLTIPVTDKTTPLNNVKNINETNPNN